MSPIDSQGANLGRYLRRLELRNALDNSVRSAILTIKPKVEDVSAGRDIVRPRQVVDHACLVESGVVGRFEQFRDGTRRTTMLYIGGDMADLHSIAFTEASWGLFALSDARIYRVPHDALASLRDKEPSIALAFWRDTTVDASVLSKWVSVLSRQQAHQRLAHLLCEYGLRMELAGLGTRDRFILPVTQDTLSEILGITTTHVNRIFSGLRKDGYIATGRRAIEVRNRKGLEQLAEYDSGYLLLDNAPTTPTSR
ncbi:MAG TPA: Crp/Fnr family transcriptional regulator [Sphingomicrobium sp.]|nr:Crp/Fnr family transcriptional regulator [Sphingomicrobium sp.]